ncbi:UDP-sugar transporter UST74c-like [Dysidea avara]|uniref:UDP-sugar transporter UST74c-like n=1 Tax=Dysidea avara TaxID=196820 RepID=UPI00332C8E73
MSVEGQSLLLVTQAGAAAFYGAASLLIIMVNKAVLTSFGFPSFQFLGLGQIVATLVVLQVAKLFKIIHFDNISMITIKKIFPLPLFYIGNLLFGLGGTQKLSLPMFVVLRRFTLLFTMLGEQYYLGIQSSLQVQISVGMMILGALVAASNDLSFQVIGYCFILFNNFCTSANVLVSKKMVDNKSDGLNKYGILFYNALVSLLPAMILAYTTGDIEKALSYDQWNNPFFIVMFLSSCIMGFVLMYSILLCTAINSPLTTMVTGCIKNIAVTYTGMFFGGDYVYSLTNFVGINVSAIGSLVYSYIKYAEQQEERNKKLKLNGDPRVTEEGKDNRDNQPVLPPSIK